MLTGSSNNKFTTLTSYPHKRSRATSDSRSQKSLGNNADFASRVKKDRETSKRFALQATARQILPRNHRIQSCHRRRAFGAAITALETNGERSRFTGIHTCDSGATCPVCAPKIAQRHAKELAAATSAAYARGWRVLHVTYTLSHHKGETLEKVLNSITDARRKYFLAGRAYQALKLEIGIEGTARALESTHGVNGWHPHFHELIFVSGDVPDNLEERLTGHWLRAVELAGGRALAGVALRVEEGSAKIADYLNKFGRMPIEGGHSVEMELSHGYTKNARREGFTPFALLAAARHGDDDAASLFSEYACAMAGRALIRWSKGLREALGLESTDEQATPDEQATFSEIAAFSTASLAALSDNHAFPHALTAATVGYDALAALLELYDIIPHPRIARLFICGDELQFVYI